MTPLPVLSCEGCGACCETVGSPPFVYLHPMLLAKPPSPGYGEGDPEMERWANVPPEALAVLVAYYTSGERDRYDRGLPCLWYDTELKRCRYYEHRPEVCREFEMGGEDCLRMREER